jgi:hypothetical protein
MCGIQFGVQLSAQTGAVRRLGRGPCELHDVDDLATRQRRWWLVGLL